MVTTSARLVVSLVAGLLLVGTAVAVSVKFVPRELMDYVAAAEVILGLCVAAVCWRATRSWGPRRATPEELVSGLDVHLGYPFLTFLAFIGAMSFGLFALVFWTQTRRWPKRLDPEGMTLRNGTRILWKDVSEITKGIRVLGASNITMNVWWDVHAGNTRAVIVPYSLAEGKGVLEFLSRALNRDFTIGS